MAEASILKQKNQAFLQEMEKQRLNKDCNRIIDLRGKVAGECQAYEFGGRKHYLDDRAYLLVKQLMARFDGRYTVGVFETVFKALKQLDNPEAVSSSRQVRLLQLDQALERSEIRITFSTPIKLRLDDVLYNGHTIDITSSAIRVNFKRTHSLELNDVVRIEFSEIMTRDAQPGLVTTAVYEIIKLDHDQLYTTAVLRLAQQDDDFNLLLADWLDAHSNQRKVDVDDKLINLESQYYQRFCLSHLSQPILWLGAKDLAHPLVSMHMMPPAQELYGAGLSQSTLEQLPLMQLAEQSQDIYVAVTAESSYSCPADQPQALKKLISWHLSQTDSRLLWLQSAKVALTGEQANAAIEAMKQHDAEYADHFAEKVNKIKRRISILDITSCFSHTQSQSTVNQAHLSTLQTLKSFLNKNIPAPATLQQNIQRDDSRFLIRTPVTVHIGSEQWRLESLDVSADGISLSLPDNVEVTLNQRILIDFERWQTLTSKVNLQAVPYHIKNKQAWNGQLKLGLQRSKTNCPESLNKFFDWVIAQNQDKLREDQQHHTQAAESRLFTNKLAPTLTSIPLFLSIDSEGKREISVVGKTSNNHADNIDTECWLALEANLSQLNELLKALKSNQKPLTTTLYVYQSRQATWHFAFEHEFDNSRDKTIFIQRAMSATQFSAFHCVLQKMTGNELNMEQDLATQLLQLRQQRAHKVKQLRQQLGALFGLAELTDISQIIKTYYQAA
jgi:hypothetical protein